MNPYPRPVVYVVLAALVALVACDIDLFGNDRRTIAGPYGLFVAEEHYYLILDKWDANQSCGILGGEVTALGWSDHVILAKQETCYANKARSGWMVINIQSRAIEGPVDPAMIKTRPDLSGLQVMAADAAWDRLKH